MPDWFLSVAEGSADRCDEPKTLLTSLPISHTRQRRASFPDDLRQRLAGRTAFCSSFEHSLIMRSLTVTVCHWQMSEFSLISKYFYANRRAPSTWDWETQKCESG